jgi:hypothetical protein
MTTTIPATVQTLDRSAHRQAWQKYSQDVWVGNPVKLDYLVARKAFEEGWTLKEIRRMLVVASPYVRAMHWEQGKEKAIAYVNQTVKAASQREVKRQVLVERNLKRQLEI